MERVEADDDAVALFAKACGALCGSVFVAEPRAVHVATYGALAALAGADYDFVVALRAARGEFGVSYFAQMPSDAARKAGVPVARPRRIAGGEVVLMRPAAALSTLGGELPPSQDGAAFLELSEL